MTRRWLARRLLGVARPVIAPLGISILARMSALLLGIAMFTLAGWQILAHVSGAAAAWPTARILWTLVAMALGKALLRYLEQFAGHLVAFRSLALLRNHFFDRLEPQAPALTDAMDSGDLLSRVTKDVDRIEVFFAHTLAPGLTALIVPPAMLVWLGASTSWWLALALTPFLLLAGVLVPSLGGRASEEAATELRSARGALSHHVTDSVQGVREILAFGAQSRRAAQMSALEARVGSSQLVMGTWVARRRGLNQALLGGAVTTVALTAAALGGAGLLTLPEMGMAIGVALGSFAPILAVEDFAVDLDQAWASARRVFEITDREPLVTEPPTVSDAARACDGTGNIVVSGVSFAYPDLSGNSQRPQVIHDLSLVIPAGRVTAVVGASGSGKSTLASLLCRTWDPSAGSISIGGVDLRDLPLEQLRDMVAHAPQHPHVFNDSVWANLLMARPSASAGEIGAAVSAAALTDWLATEPDGLDTVVGEMGERISGGQRQRLALARALLRSAPITILDEATSQLDASTEARVLSGIAEATRGRTLVVIAHRISTIREADQIVVMDGGRIVETGTWDELMTRGGPLAALVAREEPAARS